ncbi:MAG: hypothetical protein R3B51_13690 [Thermodesulfobacteriota bacterium]
MNKKRPFFSLLISYKYSFLAGLLALSLVDLCQLSIPLVIERVVDALTLKGRAIKTFQSTG